MHVPPAHRLQTAGAADELPRRVVRAVDDLTGAIGVGGADGGEQVFAGDGEGVALRCANLVVEGVERVGERRGGGGGGGGGGGRGRGGGGGGIRVG